MSKEHKKKISESEKGRKLSEEHKAKISGANNYKAKTVAQIDVETGLLVAIWESTAQAAKNLNLVQQNISKCCCHKRKTVGGYRWEYIV